MLFVGSTLPGDLASAAALVVGEIWCHATVGIQWGAEKQPRQTAWPRCPGCHASCRGLGGLVFVEELLRNCSESSTSASGTSLGCVTHAFGLLKVVPDWQAHIMWRVFIQSDHHAGPESGAFQSFASIAYDKVHTRVSQVLCQLPSTLTATARGLVRAMSSLKHGG